MRTRVETAERRDTHEGRATALKVRMARRLSPGASDEEALQFVREAGEIGERHATERLAQDDVDRVWCWVYAADMDLGGPALCLSYAETGEEPATEYTDWNTIALWYAGQSDPGLDRTARALVSQGHPREKILTVLTSIAPEDEARRALERAEAAEGAA